MDVKLIIQRIVNQCNNDDGFLILLHSHATFDETKYQELVNDILAYQQSLGNSDQINRCLAGCLFDLMLGLDNATSKFSQMQHPDKQKVESAQVEIWHLIRDLFMPSASE